MNKYQLFKTIPSIDFVITLMKLFGINSFDENIFYTKMSFINNNVIEKLQNIKDDLDYYYINCKAIKYNNIKTLKNAITLLRQFLKNYGYKVVSIEKYYNKKKEIVYYIKNVNSNQNYNLVLNFE